LFEYSITVIPEPSGELISKERSFAQAILSIPKSAYTSILQKLNLSKEVTKSSSSNHLYQMSLATAFGIKPESLCQLTICTVKRKPTDFEDAAVNGAKVLFSELPSLSTSL
jgi:hypothetical protein